MRQLKLIAILLFYPCYLMGLNTVDNLTDLDVFSKITDAFAHAWNYKVITLDNQIITLANIVIAIVSLVLGLRVARYSSAIFKRRLFNLIDLDKNSRNIVGRVIDYLFLIIIIIIVLDIAGVPLNIFAFIGGAVVISVGLSAQHLFNNFISGIVLIIESKVKVGDIIEFDNVIAKVESIEARMVQLRTQTNIDIFIPHSKLMQERFTNWTNNGGRVRLSTEFKIDSKDKVNFKLEDILLNAILQNRHILITPKPQIILLDFDNNLLHYELNFWVNLYEVDRRLILSEINNQIFNTLAAHHISLAIPSIRHIK